MTIINNNFLTVNPLSSCSRFSKLLFYCSSEMKASLVTECLNHLGSSEEELVNSSCHHNLLFLCQLDMPPIWPTESCLNEAYVTQTCHSNRLAKINASRPLPFHCAIITACVVCIYGRFLRKRNRK